MDNENISAYFKAYALEGLGEWIDFNKKRIEAMLRRPANFTTTFEIKHGLVRVEGHRDVVLIIEAFACGFMAGVTWEPRR